MANGSLPHFQKLGEVAAQLPIFPRYPGVAYALARYRARKAVESELRSQGVRVQFVPLAIIGEQAQAYLEAHRQELLDQAMEAVRNDPKLRKMAEIEQRNRERQWRKWQKQSGLLDRPRPPMITPDLPVSISGSAKAGTEKTQLFSTTSAIFRTWCLLIAD